MSAPRSPSSSARPLLLSLPHLLLALLLPSALLADGMIFVHHPPPFPVPPPQPIPLPRPRPWPRPLPPRPNFPLEVTRHRVSIEIDETAARTRVEETFFNPNDVQLEGVYLFPLPPDAAVSAFTMKMGGREVSGEVLERGKAREIYEQIVRQAKDPGLLEYVDRGLFRASVFPIPPRGPVEISLEYSESLPRERGTATYRYPLDTGKYSAGDYKDVVVDLKVRASQPIRSVYCPSHDAALVTRVSDREARISFEAKVLRADKDFVVTWNVSEDALAPVVLAHRDPSGEGFFYLTIAPRPEKPQAVPPKDVLFVIDTSGSMASPEATRGGPAVGSTGATGVQGPTGTPATKIEQAKKALRYCLQGLSPGDRFNIVDFATEARRFREGLAEVNDETRRLAMAYVDQMAARGGTNLEEALRIGLGDVQSRDRLGMVVLLTDGEPTLGVIQPSEILRTVREKNPEKRRVFIFGAGDDLNAKLLDAIAKEARGTTTYLRPGENIEVPLSNFFDKIASPVLTDLEISFTSGGVEDVYPRPLPDLFRGEQLDVFGRYRLDGSNTVLLKGKFQGEPRVFEYSLPFQPSAASAFIPRLWALRKIGYLLEQMRLVGETAEVKDEVVRLSKRYGIVTPYTSYLIIEEDRLAMRRERPEARDGSMFLYRAAADAIAGGAAGRAPGAVAAPGAPAAGGAPAEAEARASEETYDLALRELKGGAESLRRDKGKDGVDFSRKLGELKAGSYGAVREFLDEKVNSGGAARMQEVEGRTFYLQGARWIDGALLDRKAGAKPEEPRKVKYLSDEYFKLLSDEPGIGKLLSLGSEVTFLWKGKVIAVEA